MQKRESLIGATVILVFINIVVYIYTSIAGGDFISTNNDILFRIGQSNERVLVNGHYWQLFTSMFVHVSILHLANNMLFLLIFGLRAEELFTEKEYLGIYFSSGLFGNLLSLFLIPSRIGGIPVVSAGASGAIFGIFGACTIFIHQSIIIALLYSFMLFTFSASPGVNLYAHFGGLVVGLALGYLFAKSRGWKFYWRY